MRLGKYVFMIRALRVNPEFQHAARRVKGTLDHTRFLQLAYIAKVNQDCGVEPLEFGRLVNAGLVDQQPCGGDHFRYGLGDGPADLQWLRDIPSG
jgi:hypothetical protein